MKTSCIRLVWVSVLAALAFGLHAQINTEQVMRIGRNSLYFEDYVLSIQYFNQVIKAKPFLAEPYFYRAVAKINLEDYLGAESDATLAIERNPFIVDAYQVRGVARQNLGNFAGAIEDYDAGLEQMPEEKAFLLNRAVCQGELKAYDDARESYARLLKIDSKNDRAYLGLAHLSLAEGDTATAIGYLDRSIELSKNNSSAYLMRAEIAMRSRKDYAAALADMDEAVKLEPNYAGNFINRAFMKYHLDDYSGAMADYDYAITLNPQSIEAHFNRALLLAEVGDNDKALVDFSFVLKQDPSHFMSLYNRAMIYMQTGQYRLAVKDIDRVLEKYPQFEAGFMLRGEAKRKSGDTRGGNADYDHALALFKEKKTRKSDFNPIEIEVEAERKKAEQPAQEETEEDIAQKFTSLLTIAPDNPIKPEYDNRQRGHVQNSNVEVEPEPMFLLSYYTTDNKLNGNTYYMREVTEINDSRLLPAQLALTRGDRTLGEQEIERRFADIEYYNSLLAGSKPRAVDYFARATDYLLVRNPDAAVADAERALALSPDFVLAYFLRANARYLKYLMLPAVGENEGNNEAESMLRSREQQALLEQVAADLAEVTRRAPASVYAFFDRGYIASLRGDLTGAISNYSEAIRLKPDLGEAYYNRGLLYLRLGNKAPGVSDLSKAGELGVLPSYNVLKRMN